MPRLTVIGGGLAGTEAAWQAAQYGVEVKLYEMRPVSTTGAHKTSQLGELVCSNSFGSKLQDHAAGLLQMELKKMGSLLLACAEQAAIPAGTALAVDRALFSQLVSEHILKHPLIRVIREEITSIPYIPCIVASGPLTSPALAQSIAELSGKQNLYFYDAIAPIVASETIDMGIAFRASRYDKGDAKIGDYINCPLTKEQYLIFIHELLGARRISLPPGEFDIAHGVQVDRYFEACLPVEVLAERGSDALAFGPMRPVGLTDPRTGRRPYAVVQLRQDNLAATLYNMVGFQTNLKYSEQQRVFHLIPGLTDADFVRYGQMHRNTFIASPKVLLPTLQFNNRRDLFFAGQLIGVEGYLGSIATGLHAGQNAARLLLGKEPVVLPLGTMIGSLCQYVTHADLRDFQPMKANYGILPILGSKSEGGKLQRARAYAERSFTDLDYYLRTFHA